MTVLITGASDGIGACIAQLLSQQGCKVYGISRKPGNTAHLKHIPADVRDRDQVQKAIAQVYHEAGTIDVFIACAGISLASPAMETDIREARDIYDVNLWGIVNCAQVIIPKMKEARRGQVIFLSSMTGLLPLPYLSFYSSSKAALISYGCALANECHPFDVTVSVVMPGGVRTGFTEKRRKYHNANDYLTRYTMERAIFVLSHEEQTGLHPKQVANKVVHLLNRDHPPVLVPVGGWYRLYMVMQRLLPSRVVLFALRKKYAM